MREGTGNGIWPDGIKKTRARLSVLSVLDRADKPLSTVEILQLIEQSGETAWLSTIYRTLVFFEQKGVLIKTFVAGSDLALYEINRHDHRHYAVCVKCRKILPLGDCPLTSSEPVVDEPGFIVTGHHL